MKPALRLCLLLLLCAWWPAASAQTPNQVAQVRIEHRGPASVSDELIRAHIRVKPGEPYLPGASSDDIHNLYATGFFQNIRVAAEVTPQGVVVTYIVQAKPSLVEIKFQGNKKYSFAKLMKKVSSKVGEPFDERKLFTDTQEILKLYQKAGYPRTEVKYSYNIEEDAGRATATFDITESPKVRIVKVDFLGAKAFSQRKLRGGFLVAGGAFKKTRHHWMFSWITSHGFLKDDDFDDDKDRLAEFYHDHGYIDFELKDVQFLNPTPRTMVVRLLLYEGRQYRVGSVRFTGNKLFSTQAIIEGLHSANQARGGKTRLGPNGLPMDVGDIFKPKDYARDVEAVEDFYGARGYIDVTSFSGNLKVSRIPNTQSGTMDLDFQINEGQRSTIERIEIRGNTVTKDKVIRRELAVAPGEIFDLVRVRRSRLRLENMQYFSKVDARPEPTEIPNMKDLVIAVDEGHTGHVMVGAGFSSLDGLVGYTEYYQGNFDLFNPPKFTGGGQKLRLHVALGTLRQDYLVSFIEPWFLGRKLTLGTDLYYRDLAFQSLKGVYDEVRAGGRLSLSRTLFNNDFIIGSVSYSLEDVGIVLNPPYHGFVNRGSPGTTPQPTAGGDRGGVNSSGGLQGNAVKPNVPDAILGETGYHVLSKIGASLAYDTRGGGLLPNKGQRTSLAADFVGGPLGFDKEFYKLELTTAWYFKGLAKGHVLELVGRTGVADSLTSEDVPFYERYYLGGIYSLRGFNYRSISPRQPGMSEPIGGDSYWFGSAEYSIPIIEQEHGLSLRFALFYDIGSVSPSPYSYNFSNFNDNWGIGLRINLPIAPIRLDYGIPIHHDQFNGGAGKFQFGVGFERPL
ncbi:MAG: outer membrane protein assembly factor BamA [Verrucomicrobiota bacterium]|jgi:outer membrane protein insertion porin family